MHDVLTLGVQPRLMFPSLESYPAPSPVVAPAVSRFYNAQIATNERQRQAVMCIYEKTHSSAPFLIFGPPGTGQYASQRRLARPG